MTKSSESHEYLFKFLIIGSASTGKTCILHRFINDQFKSECSHTIGAEFGTKVVNIGQTGIKLQIWDTAGQERFRSVTRSYYRGACGALLVYDISNRDSYNAVINWLTDVRTLATPNIVIILCGNKNDLEDQRNVTFLEASQFAQEHDLIFFETSALENINITESFLQCTRIILSRIQSGNINPSRAYSGIQCNRLHAAHRNENSAKNIPRKSSNNCALCQT